MPNMSMDALKANLTNPQRTYLWEIIIPTPVGDGEVETFQLRAQSTEIPGRSFGAIPIDYKQTPGIIVPGKAKLDHTWACTFIEGEDHKVYDAVNSWLENIVALATGIGTGDSAIKTDILLTLIATVGTTVQTIKLKGCYVAELGKLGVDYKTDGVVTYAVTFSFDNLEVSA